MHETEEVIEKQAKQNEWESCPDVRLFDTYHSAKELEEGAEVIKIETEIREGFIPRDDLNSSVVRDKILRKFEDDNSHTQLKTDLIKPLASRPLKDSEHIFDPWKLADYDSFYVLDDEVEEPVKMVSREVLEVTVWTKETGKHDLIIPYKGGIKGTRRERVIEEDRKFIQSAADRGELFLSTDGDDLLLRREGSIISALSPSIQNLGTEKPTFPYASLNFLDDLFFFGLFLIAFGTTLVTLQSSHPKFVQFMIILFCVFSVIASAFIGDLLNIDEEDREISVKSGRNYVSKRSIKNQAPSQIRVVQVYTSVDRNDILLEAPEIDSQWTIDVSQGVMSERGKDFFDEIPIEEVQESMHTEVSHSANNKSESGITSDCGEWTLHPPSNEY